MKKTLLLLVLIGTGAATSAQVGINTENPKTTLDVDAKRDTTGNIVDNNQLLGLQAPRLTRGELSENTAIYQAEQKGALIYITDVTSGTALDQRINVDQEGYYYFDGLIWQKLKSSNNVENIYNANGMLTSNRYLNKNGHRMEFIGIDQKTLFTNDGQLYQVGLPTSSLKSATIAAIAADGNNNNKSARIDIQAFSEGATQITASGDATALRLSTSFTDAAAPIRFNTTPGGNVAGQERMIITGTGNVGIGTTNPLQKFEIHTGGTVAAPKSGFRLNDGSQAAGKVISSDANGIGTWQYPKMHRILGNLTNGVNIPLSNNSSSYTGASITLPPGKWEVKSTMLLSLGQTSCTLSTTDWIWVKTTFSDSPNNFFTSTDIIGNNKLVSGLFSGPKSSTMVYKYDMLSGSFIINNTSISNKTYYFWVHSTIADRPQPGSCNELSSFAGASSAENSIVAIPII